MKPDMFVNVEFGVAQRRAARPSPPTPCSTPAIGRRCSSTSATAISSRAQVVVGERFGDRVAITRGLSAGERVVSSGTFLIDSESQLKAAASGMGAPQHAQRAPEATAERAAMINAIIEFSAKNRFIVLPARRGRGGRRRVVDEDRAARRDPRSERHAGDRLLALGPQPRHRRRPGHVSDRHRDARRAEGEGRPRLLRFRLLVRLHRVRGRHRHLLGALADAGVPVGRPAAAAAGRPHGAGTRRDRRRLGISVRARRHERAGTASTSCAAIRTGICATT